MPPHVYLDCTETLRIGARTGIQRTVRSIVAEALQDTRVAAVPVRFDGRAFVALEAASRSLGGGDARRSGMHERARRLAVAAGAVARPAWIAHARDVASRSYWVLRRLQPGRTPVRYSPGDALVLLDATWTPDVRRELVRARAAGARVCTVIYDLVKLRRPDLVSPGAAGIYARWLERVLPLSDVVATISRAVREDVVDYLRASGRDPLVPRVRSFPLGSDLPGGDRDAKPTPDVVSALSGDRTRTFLAVGSLEARKDQATIVAAFDRLWREGVDVRLVLVGRPGWGSEALTQRLASHEARGTRLFWFADATDADLVRCYRHARALVNVSLCEGYGLPLVEAMRYGLRVIASDIAPFREVAGDAALFVPPADAGALAKAVRRVLGEPADTAAPTPPAIVTWRESTQALLALLDQPLP